MRLTFDGGSRAGHSIDVAPGRSVSLGRDPAADVHVDDERVSRPHARIWVDADGSARIEDLRSTNGTFVNGQRITGATPLQDGDSITIGNTRLTVGGLVRAGDATVVAGAQQVVDARGSVSRGPSPSMIVWRDAATRAERRSTLAVAGAGLAVLAVALVAGWYLLAGRTPSDAEILERLESSVVDIEVQSEVASGSGSGWVLDAERGLIVTNNHVIDGVQRLSVAGTDLTRRTAEIIAAAPCEDVAVIHVDDKTGLDSLRLGSQEALRQGDHVVALGYPVTASSARNLVLTSGEVSVVRTTLEGGEDIPNLPNVVQTTARINPGNSGGPLVSQQGELVGMNTVLVEELDQNYAVGVDRIREVVDTLAGGSGLAWTGMGLIVPDDDSLAELGLPIADGLLVVSVVPGTEADRAGFGDFPVLITAIDGSPVRDLPSYCAVAGSKRSGDESVFTSTFVDPASGEWVTVDVPMRFR